MRSLFSAVVAVAAVGLVAGCSNGPNKIVGFVVNGQTGERVNLFQDDGAQKNLDDDSDSPNQVFALIDGKFVRAVPCKSGDASDKNKIAADGCFQFDGVPFDAQIPVFAQIDGFERFHGTIDPLEGSEFGSDAQQIVANIRVFPKNYTVNYTVGVHHNGTAVAGTTVSCQIRQQNNSLATDGNFLRPENTTSKTVGGATDTNGLVTLNGGDLVNGALYNCEAYRADALNGAVLSGELQFTAGVTSSDLHIALRQSDGSGGPTDILYAVRSNGDNPTDIHGNPANLVIHFNRPVEILPRSADCQIALIAANDFNANGITTKARANEPGNGISESMSATLSGDGLSVTLSYKLEGAPDMEDINTLVTYSGLFIRPIGAQNDAGAVRALGGAACAAIPGINAQPLRNAATGSNQTGTMRIF